MTVILDRKVRVVFSGQFDLRLERLQKRLHLLSDFFGLAGPGASSNSNTATDFPEKRRVFRITSFVDGKRKKFQLVFGQQVLQALKLLALNHKNPA